VLVILLCLGLFAIENGIQENDEAVKKLTSLAETSDKYTKKLERDTAVEITCN
jgi:hypothetical protein